MATPPQPLPIQFTVGTLPPGAVYNAQSLLNAFAARLQGAIPPSNLIWGQIGGTQPPGQLPNSGLWFGDPNGGHGYWNDWNSDAGTYLPIPCVIGQYVSGALKTSEILCGATAKRTITTPDNSGTMALTSDIPQALGIQTYSGGSVTVNWNNHSAAWITVTGNVVITTSGGVDGQVMDYYLDNSTGSAYTLSFAAVTWPTAASPFAYPPVYPPNISYPPTPSAAVAATRVIDHYRVTFLSRIAFGQIVNTNYQIPLSSDGTLPAVVSITGSGNDIIITFNQNLAGNTALITSDFSVINNGITQTVNTAVATGTTVDVNIAAAMKLNDVATIKYTKNTGDLKGVNGNAVATFGPSPVVIGTTGGGGVHNSPRLAGVGDSVTLQ